jgi:hypothetical protein
MVQHGSHHNSSVAFVSGGEERSIPDWFDGLIPFKARAAAAHAGKSGARRRSIAWILKSARTPHRSALGRSVGPCMGRIGSLWHLPRPAHQDFGTVVTVSDGLELVKSRVICRDF